MGGAPEGAIRWRANDRRAGLSKCGRCVVDSDGAEPFALAKIEAPELRTAEPRSVRQHCLEYRLQFARRAAYDLRTSEVAVCCSSASDNSSVRAGISSNSRTFSIAITAWSAKVSTSSICLSVNGCT